MNKSKVLIVIPTYNESESIVGLLHRIEKTRVSTSNVDISVLIVDDNSPDGTSQLVESLKLSWVSILHRSTKSGLGPAYLAGFACGLTQNFDYFMEMDADGSHLPEDLPKFFAQMGNLDLTLGSRWIPGGSVRNWPLKRKIISRCGTWYAGFALRLPYKDLTSGYRLFTRKLLESLPFPEIATKGYGFQVEMALRAHDLQAKVGEVPITFVEREFGTSKMSRAIVLEAAGFVTRTAFLRLINRR